MKYKCIRGEPYFDDGNIILATNEEPPTAFRLHRGMLKRQSEIFEDMFAMPQAEPAAGTVVDGCQIVTMHDDPTSLANLISALYDNPSFQHRNINDFFYLAGILRLATKYFIEHLRRQAIQQLTLIWAHTLQGHDTMVETALSAQVIDRLTYPYVHPIHVLNLARETHVRIILPSVLYFLSLYNLKDLLRADHPKLLVRHPSRPSSSLSPSDITDYTLFTQYRIEATLDFIRRVVGSRTQPAGCKTWDTLCCRAFTVLSSRLSQSWVVRTALLHYIVQVSRDVSNRRAVCHVCQAAFQADCDAFREDMWKTLPTLVGLPSWEILISEMSSSSSMS